MQTIRQMLVPDEAIKPLLDHLTKLPTEIHDLQDIVAGLERERKADQRVTHCTEEVKNIKAGIAFEVFEETVQAPPIIKPGRKEGLNDMTIPGKISKKYPNAESRAAAQAKQEAEDSQLQDALMGLEAAVLDAQSRDHQMHMAEIDVRMGQAHHKSALAIAAIISGLSHEDTTLKRLDFLNAENARLSTKIGAVKVMIEKLENE